MATKYSISEQVLLRISSGSTEAAAAVKLPEIMIAVGQELNTVLKMEYFQKTLPSGETIPDGLMLGVYENIAVVPYGKKSKCTLPVMPMMLPRNMGIYEVSDKEDFSNLFIPMQNGQQFLLGSQDVICDLMGDIGYEPVGLTLVFNRDITVQGIKKVFAKLAVSDVSRLSDYDILPIPADLESVIIDNLIKKFIPFQVSDDKVDSTLVQNKQQP